MPQEQAKVYSDGSHYIAIPHTTRPKFKRVSIKEELYEDEILENMEEMFEGENQIDNIEEEKVQDKELKISKKELFEKLCADNLDKRIKERKRIVREGMKERFSSKIKLDNYIDEQFERKQRNLICKRIRLYRKANL